MQNPKSSPRRKMPAGFTLPAILVVVGALLILAVGVLLIVGIERNTARSFVDRQRAELAAKAGLEDIRGIFTSEAANDDFVVLQSTLAAPITAGFQSAPQLFLARGKVAAGKVSYRYVPLFSTLSSPGENAALAPPVVEPLVGSTATSYIDFETLPYFDKVRASWMPVVDDKGKMVARYSYWVEDLQSRLDAGTVGNSEDGGKHKRFGWKSGDVSKYAKFPAPGLNPEPSEPDDAGRDKKPPLNQVALYVLDPSSGAQDSSALDNTIINGRMAIVSPDSTLAVAGIVPPLQRDAYGRLTDAKAKVVEEGLTAMVQPYDEQPVVPFAQGISIAAAGKPKLNLNALIAKSPDAAVGEMASWIKTALPDFDDEKKGRQGGFPEDYLKTLAANAIGYAAPGNNPIVQMGSYRGLGASPILSEIVLNTNYLGRTTIGRSSYLKFEFELFAELLNHTNLPITGGNAQLSYEVALNLSRIGAMPGGGRFDARSLLTDKILNPNDLIEEGAGFWTQPVKVDLLPGQYKFFKFAKVAYQINIGPSSQTIGPDFVLDEPEGAAGLSMKWNGKEVERIPRIVREAFGLTYKTNTPRNFGKAAIPGHTYGPYGFFNNNMGDPRIAHYMARPLGENSFPGNISPNRRNIRWTTLYKDGAPARPRVYERVIPSEWPDGGHDCEVNTWNTSWDNSKPYDPTIIKGEVTPVDGEALTYLSDRGRYYSATELGRLYDPIMWLPTFDSKKDPMMNTKLRGTGEPTADAGVMLIPGTSWPLVQVGNTADSRFGGGNTLRIGRPEHPKFNLSALGSVDHTPAEMPDTHAARLLDLFHTGKSRSQNAAFREGPVVRVEGQVNINTASRDALRAMAAGLLVMDPKVMVRTSPNFDSRMAPVAAPLTSLSAPSVSKEADVIADAIIAGRPYSSPSELACVRNPDKVEVFGNPELYPEKEKVQWTDAAAEEVFGRVYESSTVRSRNFRVWVIGQAVAPTTVTNANPEILSEVRRAYSVFADPGKRDGDGRINTNNFRTKIINENDF